MTIALHPLLKFAAGAPPHSCTFQELNYLNLLAEALRAVAFSAELAAQTQQLMQLLVYLNFNSFRFFSFCVQVYREKLAETDRVTDQIGKAACLSKKLIRHW